MTSATARRLAALLFALLFAIPTQAQPDRLKVFTAKDADCVERERSFVAGDEIHVCAKPSEAIEGKTAEATFSNGDQEFVAGTSEGASLGFVLADDLGDEPARWNVHIVFDGDGNPIEAWTFVQVNRDDDEEDDEDGDDADAYAVRGEIASVETIDDQTVLVTLVDETAFHVTGDTRIRGERGARLGLDDLVAGLFVHAVVVVQPDDLLWARHVHLFRPHESDDVTATGPIEAIGADEITVAGLTFTVGDDTEIEDSFGNPLVFGDLVVGQIVRVEGHETDSGLTADEIRARISVTALGTFEGPITAVGDGVVEVAGVAFAWNALTRQHPRRPLDPESTGRVKVRFAVLADGTLQALRIHRRRDVPVRVDVIGTGIVSAFDGTSLVVSGIAYDVPADTPTVDSEGNPVAVEAGDAVRVWADFEAPDVLTALRVVVRDPIEIEAEVDGRVGDLVTLAGLDVLITEETDFVDADGNPTDARALEPGSFVGVVSYETTDDTGITVVVADLVTVFSASAATDVEAGTELPDAFRLEQNYPNPFNPETRIAFELGSASDAVRLDVYNMLGQRVRTLVSGSLPAGSHSVTWDGRMATGAEAASGVYLYRLQAQGRTETRTMTLLR